MLVNITSQYQFTLLTLSNLKIILLLEILHYVHNQIVDVTK